MPPGLLAAVLEGVEAQGHEARGICHADDAEDAALLAQLVVVEGVGVVDGLEHRVRLREGMAHEGLIAGRGGGVTRP
jgi:hypothetical protein